MESPCQSVKVRVSVFSLPPARVAPPTGAGAPLVDDREVPYDLLVSIPTHKGAAFLGASGLGNELDFVPTERHTLRAKKHEDVFVLGDATDLPSSKAGSVAHFQREVLVANLLRTIRGEALEGGFNGHANCFIESGFGRALLIDFNYDVEPLPGHFTAPVAVGEPSRRQARAAEVRPATPQPHNQPGPSLRPGLCVRGSSRHGRRNGGKMRRSPLREPWRLKRVFTNEEMSPSVHTRRNLLLGAVLGLLALAAGIALADTFLAEGSEA